MSVPHPVPSAVLAFADSERSPLSIRARALVFIDPCSRRLQGEMEQRAPGGLPILVEGEPGTGKELLARRIHHLSERPGLFVAVSCGALSTAHGEAELFGHLPSVAPVGSSSRAGWLGSANGGTLYLDEIADLDRHLQARLLEVLETREVRRVGARQASPVDVRLVAATSIDLARAAAVGKFDRHLYRYLTDNRLVMPPLRERQGDILPLAEYFLGVYAQRLGLPLPVIDIGAQRVLEAHTWPGNTRELENVIHFALLIAEGERILPEHLRIEAPTSPVQRVLRQLEQLAPAEREQIRQALLRSA